MPTHTKNHHPTGGASKGLRKKLARKLVVSGILLFPHRSSEAACAQRVEAPLNMMAMMLEVSLAASWSTALLVLLACSALRWLYQRWQQQKALARAVSLGVASTPQTKPPVLEAPRAPASSICPGGVCKVPKQRTTEDLVTSALALLQSQKQRTVVWIAAGSSPPAPEPFLPCALVRERLAACAEEGSIATTTWREVELAVKANPQVRSFRFGKTEVWEWRQMLGA